MKFGLHRLPPRREAPRAAVVLATWGGSGCLRPGAGTWGSLAALPPGLALGWLAGPWAVLGASVALLAAGTWAGGHLGRALGEVDASQIVVDEVVGQWLALLPIWWLASENSLFWALLGAFALFRLFDIAKPWPARLIDTRLKTPLGVMLDDVVAGVYAGLGLALARVAGLL